MGGEKIGESILYKRTRCIKSCRSHELILTRWLGELSSATSKKTSDQRTKWRVMVVYEL